MYFLLFLFENRQYRNWLVKKLICQIVHLNRKIFRVSNIEYKSCIKACISCVELMQVKGFLKSLFSSSTDFPLSFQKTDLKTFVVCAFLFPTQWLRLDFIFFALLKSKHFDVIWIEGLSSYYRIWRYFMVHTALYLTC